MTAHSYPFGSPPAVHLRSSFSTAAQVEQSAVNLSAADLIGAQGEPIPVNIKLRPRRAQNEADEEATIRFLMFRGLPEGMKFSSGFPVNSAWAVASSDLPDLNLTAPPSYIGAFLVQLTAHTADGEILAKAILPVIITPRENEARLFSLAATGMGTAEAPGEDTPSASGHPEEQRLFEQAAKLMKNGNVAGARLIYARLAGQNNGRAAYALAQSYDPETLNRMNIVGVVADAQLARIWYGKAAKLGYAPARDRLAILERNR